MADDIQPNVWTGGDLLRAIDDGGVKTQYVKVCHGATGVITETSAIDPIPVTLANTGANATSVLVSRPLMDTQLRAAAVPVSGTVTATGPLTDTQLRASAVPVSMSTSPSLVIAPYDASLFGGIRAGPDLAYIENLHMYPGAATAYDTDIYGYQTDGVVGTAAHVPNHSDIKLSLSATTSGGKSRLRTHDLLRYQPGAMPVVQITGFLNSATNFSLKCVRRTSVTGSVVDNNEGTINGYSLANANRFEIRFAYLGVQTVQWFINWTLVLQKTYAGTLTAPYMKAAVLPISVEIQNIDASTQVCRVGLFDDSDGLFFEMYRDTGAAAFDFSYICSSARIVNGTNYAARGFGFSAAKASDAATLVPIASFRLTETFRGIASRVQMVPTKLAFFSESQPGACEMYLNPTATLTGATWAAISPSSAIEIDTAATAYNPAGTPGGILLFRASQGQNTAVTYDLSDIFAILGQKIRRRAFESGATGTDVLAFGVVRESSTSFDPRVTLN